MATLDIVIPVYNEGANILSTLEVFHRDTKASLRVLICYDLAEDDTLPAIEANRHRFPNLPIEFIRNRGRGPLQAVKAGIAASTAPFILIFPADDDYNGGLPDRMLAKAKEGCEVVCATRFMPGGSMVGCPWLKAFLVRAASLTLYYLAGLPTRDATNGLRMFTRRVIDTIKIESEQGFSYSIELLVKAHRLGWKIGEVPAHWMRRKHGDSRFRLGPWLPAYLHWYFYAFATTWLRRSAKDVQTAKVP